MANTGSYCEETSSVRKRQQDRGGFRKTVVVPARESSNRWRQLWPKTKNVRTPPVAARRKKVVTIAVHIVRARERPRRSNAAAGILDARGNYSRAEIDRTVFSVRLCGERTLDTRPRRALRVKPPGTQRIKAELQNLHVRRWPRSCSSSPSQP